MQASRHLGAELNHLMPQLSTVLIASTLGEHPTSWNFVARRSREARVLF